MENKTYLGRGLYLEDLSSDILKDTARYLLSIGIFPMAEKGIEDNEIRRNIKIAYLHDVQKEIDIVDEQRARSKAMAHQSVYRI